MKLQDSVSSSQQTASLVFDAYATTKDVANAAQQANTAALIIFLDGMERECLTLLLRFVQTPRRPAILVIADEHHQELMPVLLESGVNCVLFNVVNDIPVAEWCLKQLSDCS